MKFYQLAVKTNNGRMIFASTGKPTFPVNKDLARTARAFWKRKSAIDYDQVEGNVEAKKIMANGLTKWYGVNISPQDVIFTVGGLSALKIIKDSLIGNNAIATPVPYYPYYKNFNLTSFENNPKGFLFCDPDNPTGQLINWQKYFKYIGRNPFPIIIDESYSELCFYQKHQSLFSQVPFLRKKMVIIRSATKVFSASGERLGAIICQNPEWREKLIDGIANSYVHPPLSGQMAYAVAMNKFTEDKRKRITDYYLQRVNYGMQRLQKMNINLQGNIDAGLYVLADLSRLGKTDEDICKMLLLEEQLAIAPMSFFGEDPNKGHVRITCTEDFPVLKDLFDRIEGRLKHVV